MGALPTTTRRVLVLVSLIVVLFTVSGFYALSQNNYNLRQVWVVMILGVNMIAALVAFIALMIGRVPATVLANLNPVRTTVLITVLFIVVMYLLVMILFMTGVLGPLAYDAAMQWASNTLMGLTLLYTLAWGAATYWRL